MGLGLVMVCEVIGLIRLEICLWLELVCEALRKVRLYSCSYAKLPRDTLF